MAETRLKTSFTPTCRPERLAIPLSWRRPRNVAVSFMGDLFHEAIPFEFIAAVYGVMAAASRHTFVICTKRPKRALAFFERAGAVSRWPLPNVVFLFSAENQARLDERVDDALAVPAVCHGVSLEPLLGPVNLRVSDHLGLRWVIVGCESGPQRRWMEYSWAERLRDQCVAAGVPFYLKQMAEAMVPRGVEKLPYLDGRQWTERPEVML